jgi:DNA (cytosine-5)-methyltransferase 1
MMETIFDGCSGEGGAARGYAQAGHYVVGVDSNPACREGYLRSGAAEFICADVLEVLTDRSFMSRFTFGHLSAPCQAFSAMTACRPGLRETYPDLITPGRPLLNALSIPYVIENVGAARPWLVAPVTLCMWMFGRETYRHRLIEAGGGFSLQPPPAPGWAWRPPSPAHQPARRIRVNRECGWPHPVPTERAGHWKPGCGRFVSVAGHERKEPVQAVMEAGWMSNRDAVAESIPWYLSFDIAEQLAAWRQLEAAAA